MKTRILLSLLLAAAILAGCHSSGGGSSTPDPSSVRLVNTTSDKQALDLTANGTVIASNVAYGAASNYVSLPSGSLPFTLNAAGSSATLAQVNLSLAPGVPYTLVAYTDSKQLEQFAFFPENEPAPVPGDGKIRVLNLSTDAGFVDVYLGAAGSTLSNAATLASAGYTQVAAGSYHVWVTGAGNKADVRLDLPSVAISDQEVLTLILTGTRGGVLVNGMLVSQLGAVAAEPNGSARVRLVGNIVSNGTLTASANGVSIADNLSSPVVGSYTLVPAGALSMSVTVNGSSVNVGGLSVAAGSDATLLAYGDASAPQFSLIEDDNRLPATGIAKLRLVNGVSGMSENISLSADYSPVASDIALGKASSPANLNSGTVFRLEASSSQTNSSLYLATDVTLQSQGVYSLFMLGDSAAPVGALKRDR